MANDATKYTVQTYPVISLFAGSGGLDSGFVRAGFSPVLAIELDSAACETYQTNHPECRVLKRDLSNLPRNYALDRLSELPQSVPPIGVIGGPPCQAFSLSNAHKKDNDPRARLTESYARLLKELNQSYSLDFFLFENVIGLRLKQHHEQFLYFKTLFRNAGFNIFEGALDAQDFGVPQERKRVFVVGFNKEKYPDIQFSFPQGEKEKRRTVRDVLFNLPEPVFFERGLDPDKIPFHPNHWCLRPRSAKFFNGFLKEGDIKGRPFRVLEWDKPSWTVAYGHREVHIHPTGKRRLSIYEAMLLQGFPSSYRLLGTLSDQIRLVSDAVPPPLGAALARSIRQILTTTHPKQNRKRR